MATEWEFAFLKTAIIIFCLIYSLNIPHSTQNPYFFPVDHSVSISLKFTIWRHSRYVAVVIFWKNNICFRGSDLTIVKGDWNTNYIDFFIVPRLSNQIHLSVSGLLIVMRKPVRKAYLGIMKHDWTSIVC